MDGELNLVLLGSCVLLLVEEGSGDQWGVTTDDATWGNPVQANLIASPVSYGVVPASTSQLQSPATLASGPQRPRWWS